MVKNISNLAPYLSKIAIFLPIAKKGARLDKKGAASGKKFHYKNGAKLGKKMCEFGSQLPNPQNPVKIKQNLATSREQDFY